MSTDEEMAVIGRLVIERKENHSAKCGLARGDAQNCDCPEGLAEN